MPMPTVQLLQIEEQLALLRKKWVSHPNLRDILRCQARALQIAKEKIIKKQGIQTQIPI